MRLNGLDDRLVLTDGRELHDRLDHVIERVGVVVVQENFIRRKQLRITRRRSRLLGRSRRRGRPSVAGVGGVDSLFRVIIGHSKTVIVRTNPGTCRHCHNYMRLNPSWQGIRIPYQGGLTPRS